MKKYIKPSLISFNPLEITEYIGPVQSAYVEFHYKQTGVPHAFNTHHVNFSDTTKLVKAQVVGNIVTIV